MICDTDFTRHPAARPLLIHGQTGNRWLHRRERIMNTCKSLLACVVAIALAMLAACTLGGAVAGGVVGHEVTHSPAGTIGGAVAGGIIGHELGK